MFKLHKHRSNADKLTHKIDFNLSSFHALQVPKGWDRLFVSLISTETGKTLAKLGRASVRNGSCRWTETLSDSIYVPQDDDDSMELDECLVKFAVAMGTSRSGLLGETTVNLSNYISSKVAVPVVLPLNKCDYGTILQLKIHCLTPKTKFRDDSQGKQANFRAQYKNAEYDDAETNSDLSDGAFSRSVGSSSGNHIESTPQTGKLSQDPSFLGSGSCHSFESTDGFSGKDISSLQHNSVGREDSTGSHNGIPRRNFHSTNDANRSNYASFNSRAPDSMSLHHNKKEDLDFNSSASASPPHSHTGSSKDLLEAAEVTIEELKAEARTWERNSRKLMLDMDTLKKELSEVSKNRATLDMELSASQRECNSLKQENEQLKIQLKDMEKKRKITADLELLSFDMDQVQKELEDKIQMHKESSANLSDQLQKAQQSNIELLSIIQELEGIVEAQKLEIEDLSSQKQKSHEKHISTDLSSELPEATANLQLQIKYLQQTEEELERSIEILEKALQDKNDEIEKERSLRAQALLDCESNWMQKLAVKEEEIHKLETELSEAVKDHENREIKIEQVGDNTSVEEIEFLRAKVEDLERDCNELTQENLELLLQLKGSRKGMLSGDAIVDSSGNSPPADSPCTSGMVVRQLTAQLEEFQQGLKQKEGMIEAAHVQCVDLENRCNDLGIQLQTFEHENLDLKDELHKCHIQLEEKQIEVDMLQQRIQQYEGKETKTGDLQLSDLETRCTTLESQLQTFKHRTLDLEDELQKCQTQVEEKQIEVDMLQQQMKLYEEKEMNTGDVQFPALSGQSRSPNNLSRICLQLPDLIQHSLEMVKQHRYSLNLPVDLKSLSFLNDMESKCTESTQEEQVQMILGCLSELNRLFEAECAGCGHDLDGAEVQKEQEFDDLWRDLDQNFSRHLYHSDNDLESKCTQLSRELGVKNSDIEALKSNLLKNEEQIEALRNRFTELESQNSALNVQKIQLEEIVEKMEGEQGISSKLVEDLKSKTMMLNSGLESQKLLERKSSVLAKGKHDLELQLSEMEEENVQLSERISALEAQLRYLTNEKESCNLELRHAESQAMNLREEIRRLENDMDAQKNDLKQKVLDMQKRWLEAQEEREYLKKANPKLQATAASLIEECTSLQKIQGELKRQNVELHAHCTLLESQLKDSQGRVSEYLVKIEALEAEFSSMLEEIYLKETGLNSELDALIHEDKEHKEQLIAEEILLNEKYNQKALEVENLQKELVHLIDQISATTDEREAVTSEAIAEISSLRAHNAGLELALRDLQAKLTLSESKLSTLQTESETKLQELIGELTASRQNQEGLMIDHEKVLGSLLSVKNNEEKYRSNMMALEMKLKAAEYEKLQLEEETSNLKEQVQKLVLLQDEVLVLKNCLDEAKFENERLNASLDLLTGDHKQLETEKDALVLKITNMEKALCELEDCQHRKIALEEKILRLEGDLNAKAALCAQDAELKFELNRVKRANSEFQARIKHLEQDKEECLKRARAREEEMKEKTEAMRDHGQPDMASDSCNESTASASSVHGEKQLSMNSEGENADYKLKIQSLQIELSEALEANDMYKAQLRRFLSEEQSSSSDTPTTSGKSDSRMQESDISSLETELRDLREQYLELSLKYAEVQGRCDELILKLKSKNNRRRWF